MNSIQTKPANDFETPYKKYSLREFGGALGDWGTLIPFVIGHVFIFGLNLADILLYLGITNIILGIKYNLQNTNV